MHWLSGYDTRHEVSRTITSAAATAAAQIVPVEINGAGKLLLTVGTFSTASSIDIKIANTSTTASFWTYTRLVNSGSTMCTQQFVLPHSVHGVTYDVSDIVGMAYMMCSAACSPTDGCAMTLIYMR